MFRRPIGVPGFVLAAAAGGALWLTGVAATAAPAPQDAPAASAYRPPPPPPQPIAYSHKQHLAQGLDCAMCHATARTDVHATLPSTATCMTCHATVRTDSPEIQKLKDFDATHEPVPWARVYKLADYVYFSHKVHVSATPAVGCETCHGNMREMDVTRKMTDISMAACIDCHKQRSAPVACDTCHEPRG